MRARQTNNSLKAEVSSARAGVRQAARKLGDAMWEHDYVAALHDLFRALDIERPLHVEAYRRGLVTWDYVPPKSQK